MRMPVQTASARMVDSTMKKTRRMFKRQFRMHYRTRRAQSGVEYVESGGFGSVQQLAVPQRIPATRASFLDGDLIPAFSLRDLSSAVRSRSRSLTEAIELSKPAGNMVPTGER